MRSDRKLKFKSKYKVTVYEDFTQDFMDFCTSKNIKYKQYPRPLKSRFGVVDEKTTFKEIEDMIKKFEPAPTVALS